MGSWVWYGLGQRGENLPGLRRAHSHRQGRPEQPIAPRQWHSGFLPSRFQGVHFQSKGDPVLLPQQPAGRDPQSSSATSSTRSRRSTACEQDIVDDPEIATRIAQYEMAFQMQASVPELMDMSRTSRKRSSTCTAPRRATARSPPTACSPAGWPSAACGSSSSITATGTTTATSKDDDPSQARKSIRPAAALITDLKQRGMLDDTLVVWGGEFGRTPMAQGDGRDHHIKGFSIWMAGGGIKGGITHGATDELGYTAVEDVVHVHDLHATMLHLLGIDHKRLTYRFQGRDFRLTDVSGEVVQKILV